ncbi:MAG: IS21-like element helper ATPase IstB, partial [Vulcanimicrobiaceae bacterium]
MSNALLEHHLRTLRLPTMLGNYRRLLGEHSEPLPYLADLASLEAAKRQENGVKTRIVAARFPTIKTIEAFDFTLQPQLPKAKLLEHFDGTFIEQHRNLVFCGPPGTGKSHCLVALGIAACTRGFRVRFSTAAELLMMLIEAKRAGDLQRRLRAFERVELLLIDELGYIPFEREATDLLFNVISARYERASIALTTNLAFEQWTQIFPDEMAAAAVIDRLVHHGTVFQFAGQSHR